MEEFIIEDETGTLNAASAMQETGREVDLRLEHALLARAIVETNARRNPLEGAESHGGHTGNAEGLRKKNTLVNCSQRSLSLVLRLLTASLVAPKLTPSRAALVLTQSLVVWVLTH